MRFSRLSLERYGRFADCELNFRSGDPDLHIIYGANEAGKTTSLAAVSDLLFGFPQRSPYNFMFDYILLRVGAVLEDGSRTFACRRKKGTAGTLLDTNDAAIDGAPLASMLKGQTRETFSLSFSLDQDALRSGGKAMVEAKNDSAARCSPRVLASPASPTSSRSSKARPMPSGRLRRPSDAALPSRTASSPKPPRRSETQLSSPSPGLTHGTRCWRHRPHSIWLETPATWSKRS